MRFCALAVAELRGSGRGAEDTVWGRLITRYLTYCCHLMLQLHLLRCLLTDHEL